MLKYSRNYFTAPKREALWSGRVYPTLVIVWESKINNHSDCSSCVCAVVPWHPISNITQLCDSSALAKPTNITLLLSLVLNLTLTTANPVWKLKPAWSTRKREGRSSQTCNLNFPNYLRYQYILVSLSNRYSEPSWTGVDWKPTMKDQTNIIWRPPTTPRTETLGLSALEILLRVRYETHRSVLSAGDWRSRKSYIGRQRVP